MTEATIEPAARLRAWLSKRPEPPPEIKIKKIAGMTESQIFTDSDSDSESS